MTLDSEIKNQSSNEEAEDIIDEESEEESSEETTDLKELQEMTEVGLFYGKKKSKTHPKMKKFVLTTRNGVEIFDLTETIKQLDKAIVFIKEINEKKGKILVVGTQPAAKAAVKDFSEGFNFPYVTNKWVGGVLTNFGIVRKRVDKFSKLKADKESGRLAKYNKKEMSKINREMEKMDFLFSGIEKMDAMPNAILIFNPKVHMTALREAKKMNIPVVAILNSDSDPKTIDYPIAANDNAEKSIKFILEKIKEGVK
ncbi:MAG: 30S ribosomal protein S2 [Candidatus Pacebacteria bacterium]|nr:30S ribosomal protein S2 [Candidatus Paceibacterota bacterium]